ncbi:MAG: DUF3109 family protein [Bacteroidales bacterium]|nr:DUF3109 family protein [Candidatus Scybalocola fimicaballi]
MLQIQDTIVSFDVLERRFLCDLAKCKGICCIEGDSGAPLEDDEIPILERLVDVVWDQLSEESKAVIKEQGVWYTDVMGDKVTSIVNGKECVFTTIDEDGMCKCALEVAYREGRSDFYKPISCHLYPVRLDKVGDNIAVNYHKWDVCKCARKLGSINDLPVYKFLKEPLIRRFGQEWYDELELCVGELKKQGMIK